MKPERPNNDDIVLIALVIMLGLWVTFLLFELLGTFAALPHS